ncbi:FecR domain-containing protein [Butyricimonas faecihominis]|jgi:transmembrane sensor|uniref:FecR family protein n=1 Tax=Butyricimonas faecihominis TaxID=1472416 RepID=UPI0032C19DEC
MKLTNKHFRIAEIMAAFFTGSQTEQDERDFEEWTKESDRHRAFVDRLLNPEEYEENRRALDKFQVEEAWSKMDKKIGDTKVRKLPSWKWGVRYAAVVLVLLSAGVYYWWNSEEVREEVPVLYQIAAGTTGARLTLGDGSVVDVLKDRAVELKEVDGTKIVTDSIGIDYSTQETVDTAEVMNTVQTLTGMEYMLTLSDGTRVFLNAETKLKFPTKFRKEERVVVLEGEAYFEVRKDATHPFIVKANDVDVKVLGTSFNLRSYSDENSIATTLVSGKVAVYAGENSEEIVPGEQAVYMKETGKMEVKPIDVTLYTAWHTGKFIFRNETLEEMMSYLSRWYGVKYRFIDEGAKKLQIGARLDRYNNMNPIIEMLKKTGLVNITQVDNMLYISSTE